MNRLSNKAKPYVIRASEIPRAGRFSLRLAGPEVLGKGPGSCIGSQANLLLGVLLRGAVFHRKQLESRKGLPTWIPIPQQEGKKSD